MKIPCAEIEAITSKNQTVDGLGFAKFKILAMLEFRSTKHDETLQKLRL